MRGYEEKIVLSLKFYVNLSHEWTRFTNKNEINRSDGGLINDLCRLLINNGDKNKTVEVRKLFVNLLIDIIIYREDKLR